MSAVRGPGLSFAVPVRRLAVRASMATTATSTLAGRAGAKCREQYWFHSSEPCGTRWRSQTLRSGRRIAGIGGDRPSVLIERLHPDSKNVLGQLALIAGGLVGRSVAGNQGVVDPVRRLLKLKIRRVDQKPAEFGDDPLATRGPTGRSSPPAPYRRGCGHSPPAPAKKPPAEAYSSCRRSSG